MKFLLALIVTVLLSLPVYAEPEGFLAAQDSSVEYCSSDVPKDILDEQTITSTLTITDIGEIADLNVKVNIDHAWISDIIVSLIAPDGTLVDLFSSVGHGEGEFDNTILDNEVSQSISGGSSPFSGTYKPEGNLSRFYGKSMEGTWKLQVTDTADQDTGILNSWCLIIEQVSIDPISAPIVHSEATVPGGICDKVVWEMPDNAQEYQSSTSVSIPGHGTKTLTQFINDFGIIDDLNVKLDINHNWVAELEAYLIAPDGTRVKLFSGVGGSSDDFVNTIFDNEASQSITDGTAPFTGSYHPEGDLETLIGKEIHGTWTLEVTDDGWNSTGTVQSWSLIAELANVLFKVQCSTNSNFSNITDESGWIMDNSYVFNGLDPNQVYWYRVKARPLETWYQTSQPDFETDTLTNTIAADEGDVVLPVSNGNTGNELMQVIGNPSFEYSSSWYVGSDDFMLWLYTGVYPGDIWVFDDDISYIQGHFVDTLQPVDWTGINILKFDFCNVLGYNVTAKVLIGDNVLWTSPSPSNTLDARYNISIDVSGINGIKDLILRVQVKNSGQYTAGIFWDNLRTYGSTIDEGLSGSIVSTPISINDGGAWDIIIFNATSPAGTTITVDVLGQTGSTPISGYRNILSGTDLSGLTQKTIRLRANLSSDDSSVTPLLHDWLVSYTNTTLESDWSNVVTSQCN
jgi:subtilisin-like proprotein convertase family protein